MATVDRRDLPNILTILRVVLVPVFVVLVLRENFGAAAFTFALAVVTDAVDGYIARKFSISSRFGANVDPAADKLLLVSAYILLGQSGLMPVWLSALVILRDLIMVAYVGARAVMGRGHNRPFTARPMALGKISTVFQALSVLAVLSLASGVLGIGADATGRVLQILFMITGAITILSGMGYALREFKGTVPGSQKNKTGAP